MLRRRVTVSESATEIGGRLEFGAPKSYRARTAVLPPFMVDRLAAHMVATDGELVFTAPEGGPMRHGSFLTRVS